MKYRNLKITVLFLALTALSASYYNENILRNIDFVEASIFGDYPYLESELKGWGGVNAPYGQQGEPTALMLAAERGDAKMSEFLIARKANLNLKDNAGLTPLMYAARKGDINIIKLMLNNGALVNMNDNMGSTALEIASGNGFTDVVKLLISRDARNGIELAISAASKYGHTDIVKILLSANAPVTMKDREGFTALYHAVNGGYVDTVEALIKGRADVNMTQKDNITPLMASAKNGDLTMTKLLLSKGAVTDMKNYDGMSAFIEAVKTNMHEMAELFAGTAVNVNERDYQHNTPLLHLALLAEKPDVKIAEFLIAKGADMNSKNRDGKTALILSSANGHLELVKLLVEKGADIALLDRSRRDAVTWAALSGNQEIVDILAGRGAKAPAVKPVKSAKGEAAPVRNVRFFNALATGNINVIQYETEKGIDVNGKQKDGSTPLIISARSGLPQKNILKIMKILIKHAADPNVKNNEGMTALDYASDNNRTEIVKYLIDKDAEKKGIRLFLYACRNNDGDLMNYLIEDKKIDLPEAIFATDDHRAAKILISAGADVNATDKLGRTPLITRSEWTGKWSFYKNSLLISEYLKAGADINAKDSKKRSALSIARSSGNKKLAEFLLKNSAK